MKTDTIAAIATALNNAGLSIVRISGDEAFEIIDKIYVSKNGKKVLSEQPPRPQQRGSEPRLRPTP